MRKDWIFILILIILAGTVSSQVGGSFSQSVTYQPRASFQAIYGPEDRLNSYWPILGDKESCQARQDLLLQISPIGCQPAVVRSDLLAEQNVPVFCQIDALQINPLVDIDKIKSIRFGGKYPADIVGAGFHPARAALRTRDKLLGSPLINNIGYIVVVLKKNPVEKNLPNFVNVTLTAQIDYEAGNSFGVGKAEFILEPIGDSNWDQEKFKQSFWNGRYFVRLEQADPNFAIVSLYSGDKKISTTKVQRGETTLPIWVPGVYCRAGIKISYDGLIAAEDKATLSISDDKGTDTIEVYKGTRFLNDQCTVDNIEIFEKDSSKTLNNGKVNIRCPNNQKLELKIGDILNQKDWYLSGKYDSVKKIDVYLDSTKKTTSGMYFQDAKVYIEGIGPVEFAIEIGEIKNDLVSIDSIKFKDAIINPNLQTTNEIKNSYEQIDGAKIVDNLLKLDVSNSNMNNIDELNLGEENDRKLNEAIADFKRVANEYPAEKENNVKDGERWGERALKKAIDLAVLAGKEKIRADLIKEFIDRYSDSSLYPEYKYEFNLLKDTDFSKAGGVINIDQRFYNIRLIGLNRPKKQSNADFAITGLAAENINVQLNELKNISDKGVGTIESIRLDKLYDEDNVKVSINCRIENVGGKYTLKSSSYDLKLNEDATKVCDKSYIRLKNADIQQIARVRLLPEAQGTTTETNLSVRIGIEKRAIKLSPGKTEEMIENLNSSIKKWENINEKLGKVVTSLKGACFATAGILTVKNFLTGIDGEALARQKVMIGWTKECSDLVNSIPPKYPTLNACYLAKADEIDKDVNSAKDAINGINSRIEGIENNNLEGSNINRAKAAVAYCNDLKTRYKGKEIEVKGQKTTIDQLLGDCKQGYNDQGLYGYNELREIEYNLIMKDKASSVNVKSNSNKLLQSSYDQIYNNKIRYDDYKKTELDKTQGLPSTIFATSSVQKNVVGEVVSVGALKNNELKNAIGTGVEHISRINVYSTPTTKAADGSEIKGFDGGNYVLGLQKNTEGFYDVSKVIKENKDGTYTELSTEDKSKFGGVYGIGRITSADSVSYVNSYDNPEIRYYETEPYKGMPAIVPFDIRDGWYAATRQTLPAFGGIGAFDSSGRVTSFYLCNVGPNHQEQFFEGYGDDICQLINLNTGQPYGFFPGLSETEAKRRVGQAVQSIEEASNQYGKKIV